MRRRDELRVLVAAGSACLLLSTVGCGGPSSGPEQAAEETVYTYASRGIIRQLPDPARPTSELQIQHEAIPDFVSVSGEVVGMRTMTMPFPVADAVSLEGFAPGDAVAFTFEVRWEGSPPYSVTTLAKLPPGAALELGGTVRHDESTPQEPMEHEAMAEEAGGSEESKP